ncbi:N-acetyltransferase [Microbacterium bovistercoris]|uniref:N-acetyltransferase n=1 Tax=Microbacterium bovistercoris TaxID=2293570 RepID=A0A371NXU2_9MICO|nr:GNAT family protein [Microbacterium bovistercoris]REJ08220.1 N-acetyltransferase [Microbacterium bovistercoris]
MEPVALRTDRLVLSIPTEADVDAITSACQDPEVPRWTPIPSPYSRADAETFVERVARWWDEGAETVWAVRLDGVLAGMVGLHQIVGHATGGYAELGYWSVARFRGRGIMTEAARAVVDWGFEELGLVRIGWRATVGNIPSARTARTLGFRYEGMLRQGLTGPRGRDDGWLAALLVSDDRTPVAWPVLAD